MGLFDFLKPKKRQSGLINAPTMTGYNPTFTSFGDNVYASDIVVQSISCKANEFKKLKPRHIVMRDGRKTVKTDSSIARIRFIVILLNLVDSVYSKKLKL